MTYAKAMDKYSPCDSCHRFKDCAANKLLCPMMKAWISERKTDGLSQEPSHWIFNSVNKVG